MQIADVGVVATKESGVDLILEDVSAEHGDSILVCCTYVTGSGAPVVKWGQRDLYLVVTKSESGITTEVFLRTVGKGAICDVVASWDSTLLARAMAVTVVSGANVEDVMDFAGEDSCCDPTTGTGVNTTFDDTMCVAFFGSNGPVEDAVGTVGSGHTSDQRNGTTGGDAASNITIHQTHEELSAVGECRSTKTGATARVWANAIVALRAATDACHGVTPGDMALVKAKFDALSLDYDNASYTFNDELNRWEVYDGDITSALVAHSGNGWE